MLTRRAACTRRTVGALVLALLAGLTLTAAPAAAQDEIAPPYKLDLTSPGNLVATPELGFSTIAITVVGGANGGNVVFTPGAFSAPAGCMGTGLNAPSTSCPASLVAASLTITASVVQVDVRGVETQQMTINGGADTDTITVQGPAATATTSSRARDR